MRSKTDIDSGSTEAYRTPNLTTSNSYLLSILVTAVTIGGEWWVNFQWPLQWLLMVPVAVAAYLGGLGAGVLSTGLAAVGGRFLFEGSHFEMGMTPATEPLPWLVFAGVGLLISGLTEALHRARGRLESSDIALRNTQRIGKIGNWEWDLATGAQIWSDEMYRLFARDPGAQPVAQQELPNFFSEESWSRFAAAREHACTHGTPYECDLELKVADGRSVWVTARGGVMRDASGKIVKLYGTMIDISDRKAMERQREGSMILLQGVLDTILEGIVTIDERGSILSFNPAAERIFGFRAEEMVGQPIHRLMPTPYQSSHNSYLKNYLDTGQRKIIGIGREVEGIRKDGTVFPLDLSVGELRIDNRRVFVGALRDITERRRVEEALKSSQAQIRAYAQHLDAAIEAERLRMAREIHDDLGQSLTSIKMDLAALRRRLKPGLSNDDVQNLEHRLNDVTSIADTTIGNVRRITMALRPPLLERVGLCRAIQMHCRVFAERTGIHCDTEGVRDINVDEPRAIAVYRIFQEAITNIARHAHASEVKVTLDDDDDRLILTVHNDGVAIRPASIDDPHAFGLIGMRERARALGGSVEITGREGVGTQVSLVVPTR